MTKRHLTFTSTPSDAASALFLPPALDDGPVPPSTSAADAAAMPPPMAIPPTLAHTVGGGVVRGQGHTLPPLFSPT